MISERELRSMAARRDSSIIIDDVECRRCSYNLKGLKRGGKCPECGTPITTPERRAAQDTSLVTAPRWYLVRLSWASRIMFVTGVVGPPSALIIRSAFGEQSGAVLGLVWASIWLAAVWFITGRRQPGNGEVVPPGEDRGLITAARVTQSAWLVAMLFWVMAASGTLPSRPALATCGLCIAIGYLSIAVLAFRLATLAECAADSDFARVLRGSWVILIAGPVIALFITGVGMLLSVIAPIFKIAMPAVAGIAWFVALNYLLWRNANLMAWALQISREMEQRDERLIERAKQGLDRGGPRLCPHCGENVSAVIRTMRCPRCGEMTA